MTLYLVRVKGREGICVGHGPGYRERNGKSVPCTVAIVIFGPNRGDVQDIALKDIEATNLPKKFKRKLKKSFEKRHEEALENTRALGQSVLEASH